MGSFEDIIDDQTTEKVIWVCKGCWASRKSWLDYAYQLPGIKQHTCEYCGYGHLYEDWRYKLLGFRINQKSRRAAEQSNDRKQKNEPKQATLL